ncbi:/ / Type III restriction enzyme / 10420:12873 Reverse [Candidatus Hepatoplasma crinochetorum]|uniref:/ / Type III restriction enzyme / 10420:12873 Reverse n=1 Tax=Candidatus Hepatoplasma crinochetorum TaxID=295596 RepID=A0A0G7ZL66_9MOLU|nr:/ / Type III restriction enzyme / 10420:12873 Reverse [Candidatus Hepatoplasma crinochetorum]
MKDMKKLYLLDFQEKLIEEALTKFSYDKTFIFQSPTGTGKTFICANLINKFILENEKNNKKFVFLFFAPSTGKLDFQGYEKFKNYKITANLKKYDVHYQFDNNIKIDYFEKNTIYFFGWDKLIKITNNLTNKETEKLNFWDVLRNTIKNKLNIFIIIDEQHLNKFAKQTKNFLNDIKKILIENKKESFYKLEMSATVINDENDEIDVKITYDQAVNEAIVKKEIIINDDIIFPEETIEKTLINSALEKQKLIIEKYRNKKLLNEKGHFPLIVIQIPDAGTKKEKEINIKNVSKWVNELIDKKHIAIYTSEYKKTLDNKKIERQDIIENDDIHVLIFKQAIATGWDIPRANIWIKLRLNMNEKFEVQTLGRVLRNQFLKYFNDPLIDNAYIYTLDSEVKREIIDNYQNLYNKKEIIKKNTNINKIDQFKIIDYKENSNFDKKLFFENILLKKIKYIKEYSSIFENIRNNDELLKWEGSKLQKGIFNSKTDKDYQNFDFSSQQQQLNWIEYNLYRRYKLFEESVNNKDIQEYLEKIIRIKGKEYNQNNFIKKAYKYFYENTSDCITFKNQILKIINENKYQKIEREFNFKNNLEMNEIYLNKFEMENESYDQNNFYMLNFEKNDYKKFPFDSIIERDFYSKFIKPKNRMDFIKNFNYILYNFVDQNNYFYISYQDKNDGKLRKYFPDFILSTDNNLYIIEIKQLKDNKIIFENSSAKKIATENLIKNKEILKNNDKNVFYETIVLKERDFRVYGKDLSLEDYFKKY